MKDENINLIKLFSEFYIYKIEILIIISLTLFFTTIYIQTQTPIYASSMLVSIERDDASSMKILSPKNVLHTMEMKSKLDYESSRFKSYSTISKVLDKIGFFQKVFLKKVWRDEELFVKNLPFTLQWQSKFKDNEKFQFEFQSLNQNSFYISFNGEKEMYQYDDVIEIKNYKLRIEQNDSLNSNNCYLVKINTNKSKAIKKSINNLTISEKANRLLNIKYEDTVAPRIKAFLSQLVLTYKSDILEKRQAKEKKNILFYDKTIKQLAEVLQVLGNKLKEYKTTHSELSMVGSENRLFLNVLEKENKLSLLSLQLNDLKTTKRRISNNVYSIVLLENSALRTESLNQLLTRLVKKKNLLEHLYTQKEKKELLVLEDRKYTTYLNKLQEDKELLRRLRREYTDNYLEIKELKENISKEKNLLENYLLNKTKLYKREVSSLKQEVLRTLDDLIQSTENKYTATSKILVSNKNSIDSLPKSSMQLETLKRKFKLNEDNYKTLLKRRSESMISKTSNIVSIDIVDMPIIANKSIKPKKAFLYFAGLIMALFLATLYVSIQRYLKQRIQKEPNMLSQSKYLNGA